MCLTSLHVTLTHAKVQEAVKEIYWLINWKFRVGFCGSIAFPFSLQLGSFIPFCFLWGSLGTANNVGAIDFLTDLRKKERVVYTWELHYRNKKSSFSKAHNYFLLVPHCPVWVTGLSINMGHEMG